MQQINYKCTSQQCGGDSYISKNTLLSIMTIQLWKITNLRRLKDPHPHPNTLPSLWPLPSKIKKRKKNNYLKCGRGERGKKAMSVRLHTQSTPACKFLLLVNSSLRQRRNILCIRCCWLISRGFSGRG